MCGGNDGALNDPRRFGALAVLNKAALHSAALDALSEDLSGQIVLFNEQDHASSWATHVKFTPVEPRRPDRDLVLNIACTGDLSIPWSQCHSLYQLNLSNTKDVGVCSARSVEFRLPQHLHLSVGDRGIIGRRVSISAAGAPNSHIAEGIIGFNTASTAFLEQT
ncbi:hypothetical protein BD289DRAFT_483762 [Coniella lustricola]|uniref:Uncharacterized protein n=1 Tax=Coniella lustricola TaxID=2025994 RepID=A0A2T3A4E4_9PEZI|nr:hypothetical protein BD289DRAFT_483762 [Coniella lustricola]